MLFRSTVLFFHGNAENISTHFLMFYWLPEAGYNYMIFDYPGYGESTGEPSPKNTIEAGIAAAEWLYKNKDQRPLIVYGHSLGGIIAMGSAKQIRTQIPIRNLVIEASFSSYKKVARRALSKSWITWILQPITYVVLSDKYSPEPLSDFAPIPMLFIHGDADQAVPVESSKDMFNEAKDPKELWIIPGGHHGDIYNLNRGENRQKLLNYLAK